MAREIIKKEFYVEFVSSEEQEPYTMQSKVFPTPELAKMWFEDNFDYVSEDMAVFLMVMEYSDEDNYDIDQVMRLN